MSYFKFPAVLNDNDGATLAVVTAFNSASATPVYTADERHPHFARILEGLREGDPRVWEWFDVASGVINAFNVITDRVSYDGKNVLFDGDPVHSVLAEQLSRAIEYGDPENYKALALFWEKLESNPTEHSRVQAYDWLSCHKFQITPEGDVVGFKGVVSTKDGYKSWASSAIKGTPSGYVNGVPIKELSQIPQKVGDIVTMPRSEVAHDPREACKRGLHVATHGYAQGYGDTVLEVHVNPRDIVSVPTDGHGAKVRACRYTVARVASGAVSTYETPVLREGTGNVWAGDVGYTVR